MENNTIRVRKRSGVIVDFDISKIKTALRKAFDSMSKPVSEDAMDMIALRVLSVADDKIKDGILNVEDIQNAAEIVLIQTGFVDVAKAYMEYRQKHQEIRDVKKTELNYAKLVDEYLGQDDWRVKENSTVTYTLGGLILSNSGAVTANYWLSQVYDQEIADAHRNADIHIHDLSMLSPYCAGWSLKQLIKEGLGGVQGRISSTPASHLSTLCNQMVNFLGCTQNEWAGAQAFSSFDTYLAPFVKADNLSYKEVKQAIQSFVFGVNTPSRWGCQAPFTNVTIDWTVPDDLKNLKAIVGGKEADFTYGDCKKEMDMVNKAFLEIFLEGDANGRGFQYPIPTYSITKDFDWSETENNKLLFDLTAKYGTPYFSNYINSSMNPSDCRSMCPLTSDTEILVKNSRDGIVVRKIGTLYDGYNLKKTNYLFWNGHKWVSGHPVQMPMTPVFKIVLSNGTTVKMGENHLQPTKDRGTLKASDLEVGDWLPFNKTPIETERLGDSDLGFAIGAYAGDGSHDEGAVVYSLNVDVDQDTVSRLTAFWNRVGYPVKTTVSEKVEYVRVDKNPFAIVSEYIDGDALTKKLSNRCFNASNEFKEGFISGLRASDGSKEKKRIYTSSETMKNDVMKLLASMGHKALSNYIDNRESRLSDKPNYRIDFPDRERYGELFDQDDSYNYYKIVSIEKTNDASSDFLYCLEIDSDDHVFALASGLMTHNCRLRLDLRELRKRNGGFFGAGESTGSIGVVTINMPRIGYLAKDKDDFYKRLDHMMDICARSLEIKRKVVTDLYNRGLYPYSKRYLGDVAYNNHFSTIGLVGMNEACLNANWLKCDLTHKEAQDFTEEVLNHMRTRLSDYQEQYPGTLFNLEATPAESTAYRLAKHDKERYPGIITAGKPGETPYYTNSSHLPVGYTSDIFSALDVEDKFQTLYTSGTVFHAFLGQRLPNWQSCMKLVRKIAENYKLPYYTMSPTYSICPEHGYLEGEQWKCPYCGKETEVYSRITGYYRPVKNWNAGKAQEFHDRQTYVIGDSNTADKHSGCDGSCQFENNEFKADPKPGKVDHIMIFTSPTCPNCKMAKMLLDKAGIKYENIDAASNKELTMSFGITKAPTMLVPDGDSFDVYDNASQISGWIKESRPA